MYEEIAPRRSGAFRDVFLIVVGGFLALSLPRWLEALNTPFDLPFVQAVYELLVFLGIGIMIFRFLRFYAVEYRYSLVGSVLLIRSRIGRREGAVVEITLTSACELIPLGEATPLIREKKWNSRRISYGVSDKKSAYLLTFPLQHGETALIFQPSDKFVKILQQKLLDKPDEM